MTLDKELAETAGTDTIEFVHAMRAIAIEAANAARDAHGASREYVRAGCDYIQALQDAASLGAWAYETRQDAQEDVLKLAGAALAVCRAAALAARDQTREHVYADLYLAECELARR